jgi:hypothetical protein
MNSYTAGYPLSDRWLVGEKPPNLEKWCEIDITTNNGRTHATQIHDKFSKAIGYIYIYIYIHTHTYIIYLAEGGTLPTTEDFTYMIMILHYAYIQKK